MKISSLHIARWMAALALLPTTAIPQWVQTNGPGGGTITCFAIVPEGAGGSKIAVGTYGDGIFVSTNNGENWAQDNTGLKETHVLSLAFLGGNLIAGGVAGFLYETHPYGGVYLSTNGGTGWMQTGFADTTVSALAVSPNGAGGAILLAATSGGIFLSADSGVTWAPTGYAGGTASCLAVLPKESGGTTLVAATSTGVLLASDNGLSWSPIDSLDTAVYSLTVSGTRLFAATAGGVIAFSHNGDTSWTQTILTPTSFHFLVFSPNGTDGTNIFAANEYSSGVYRSTNDGATWSAVSAGLANLPVRSLAASHNLGGGTNLFVGTSNGAFLSTDNGTHWTPTGVPTIQVGALALSSNGAGGTNVFAGASNGIFLSTNRGTDWARTGFSAGGASSLAATSSGATGTNIFAGNYSYGVFLSTNNGATWALTDLKSVNVRCLAVSSDGLSGTDLLAGTTTGIYRSTDDGKNWSPVRLTDTTVASLAVSGTSLFAGTARGNVFHFTRSATVWTETDSGYTINTEVRALAAATGESGGTQVFAATHGAGVYRSTDNGASWTQVNEGLGSAYLLSLAAVGPNLFAGSEEGGVFLSTNSGANWTEVSNGLTSSLVSTLVVSGTALYGGTAHGVWKRPLSEMITSVEGPQTDPPVHFRLEQNYPNPFNPTTAISFQLSAVSKTKLVIYDVLGREVAVLVDDVKMPGRYQVRWDAANCSSGMYFCRLQVGSFAESRRLVLLR